MRIVILILSLVIWFPADANIIDQLPPGHWLEVPNSKMRDVCPPDTANYSFKFYCKNVVAAWSGGTFDTSRNQLLLWGGGHADYAGNEVYAFDLDTLQWSRLTDPTLDFPPDGHNHEYPDGNPSSRHTYSGVVYIPEPWDQLWQQGGSVWRSGGGTFSTWGLDLKTRQWHRLTDALDSRLGVVANYDPVSGRIFHKGRRHITEYDPVNDIYVSRHFNGAGWWNILESGTIAPQRRIQVYVGSGVLNVFDLETYEYQTIQSSGDKEIELVEAPGVAYSSALDKIVAWEGDSGKGLDPASVYMLDLDTWNWQKVNPAPNNTTTPSERSASGGTYGRFQYVPSRDVFVLYNRVDENVYIYRMNDSRSVQPPSQPPSAPVADFGDVTVEPKTLKSLAFTIEINEDTNDNATGTVQYRRTGATSWKSGMDLHRVYPKHHDDRSRPEVFTTSIFDLEPDRSYEVRFTITDPETGTTIKTAAASTREIPVAEPLNPRLVTVSDENQFRNALNNASAGDVIELQPGTYFGSFALVNKDGTASNPIIIKGIDKDSVIIDGQNGSCIMQLQGNYVYLQDVTIQNSNDYAICSFYGGRTDEPGYREYTGVTVRRTLVKDTAKGFSAWNSGQHDYNIYDNIFEGRHAFGNFTNQTWNDEGIRITGDGHAVFNNTLSGFGDCFSLSRTTYIPNKSIDFYNNLTLYCGDDGIELDDCYGNCRAWNNMITNSRTVVSMQHNTDHGGPLYAVRNMGIAQRDKGGFKLNGGASGVYILHNSLTKVGQPGGSFWQQHNNGQIANGIIANNLFFDPDGDNWGWAFEASTDSLQFDYNGYYPSAQMWMGSQGSDSTFEDFQSRPSSWEDNGRVLTLPVLAQVPHFGPDDSTQVAPTSLELHPSSNAVDGGLHIIGINDGYLGNAPDLGALELGREGPVYGARFTTQQYP